MTSKTFNLGDGSESGSGSCAKISMFCCCLLVVVVIITVAVYAYKSNYASECGVPMLDENGLSNWTTGAGTIAYACFPGYFLEGHTNILVADCINGSWTPSPPACNFLPLRLDCEINYKGLLGNVSMWQKKEFDPAHVYGLADYEDTIRSEGHLMALVSISKSSCVISDEVANVTDMYPEPTQHSIKIEFNSTQLKAYNKAEIHINLIFVDNNTTASLVSIHQDDLTLVMPNSIPFSRLPRNYLTKLGIEMD